METCAYENVKSTDSPSDDDGDDSWKYFFRQLVVCSTVWTSYLLLGVCVGAPTVYVPQIRREANSTAAITDSMTALLFGVYGYGAIPWVFILPAATSYFGRKKVFIVVHSISTIAVVTFYTSTSFTQLLISNAMESILSAAILTVAAMVITEYTSPKYRGFFLTFKSATFCWGIWVSNTVGTFFHWKNIGLVEIILSLYPLVTVFFWPESPLWLAQNNRKDECIRTHRWLKGCSNESEKDLQRTLTNQHKEEGSRFIHFKVIKQKQFYKATLLGIITLGLYQSLGKLVVSLYSIDIIKVMTSSESTANYGMLILDGVTILGMYLGSVASRYVKRRSLFLSTTYVSIGGLYVLSLYDYLVRASHLSQNKYVSVALLSIYSLAVGCGPMILCSSLYAELLPLNHRSFAMCLVAITDRLHYSTLLHVAPLCFKKLGPYTAFLFFAIASSILVAILYRFLPETKDKSLNEIADAVVSESKCDGKAILLKENRLIE